MPMMVAINAVTPVRETADELVVEVRYRYAPRFGGDMEDGQGRVYCADWADRRFTLTKRGGGLAVSGMTGEQRPPAQ
jgi:hypothetical protein